MNVIKLTDFETGLPVLIGTESIIRVRAAKRDGGTAIESRHAMVTTTYVTETVEEVYELIKSNHGNQ